MCWNMCRETPTRPHSQDQSPMIVRRPTLKLQRKESPTETTKPIEAEIIHNQKVYETYVGMTKPLVEYPNLTDHIQALIAHNNKYYDKLELLQTGVIERANKSTPLKNMFDGLKIDELLSLHKAMSFEFELLNFSFKEIGPIFQKLHDSILVTYANYVNCIKEISNRLRESMIKNREIKRAIQNLEISTKEKV